jgi:hypothetical protein
MPGLNRPSPNPQDENTSQNVDAGANAPDSSIDEPLTPPLQEDAAAEATALTGLPPEAQGETNGGPLGCCLGITVGIMFCLLLGVIGFGQLLAGAVVLLVHADAITTTRIATGVLAATGALLGGFLGWKIGKRLYKEYELSPRQKRKLELLERKYGRQSPQQVGSWRQRL